MITVVIATHDSAQSLGPCLASLVPAAVGGLVREVVIADAGSGDATLAIAEDCGARIVRADGDTGARLTAGCVDPRGDWLLILQPDAVLPETWRASIEKHLAGGPNRAAALPVYPERGWARLLGLERLQGLLISTRHYGASGGFRPGDRPLVDLARASRALRLRW
ncbi:MULTISPECIES: glycosyltransferase [unclassified Caulobacter]|uniref:glycosyltransferase n=1 Tax=unclassified Caulobacter TaxID=2648921 RepID=UPI000D375A48|nr:MULTISPECIES: glycosyltransferase [unclassified Caulobacter]PTS90534.1 glycosyltransferase [Caulobacter sp. HMWF009]PTT04694.1 glycosyltransferase [Caulobacter sp. HMWF025]